MICQVVMRTFCIPHQSKSIDEQQAANRHIMSLIVVLIVMVLCALMAPATSAQPDMRNMSDPTDNLQTYFQERLNDLRASVGLPPHQERLTQSTCKQPEQPAEPTWRDSWAVFLRGPSFDVERAHLLYQICSSRVVAAQSLATMKLDFEINKLELLIDWQSERSREQRLLVIAITTLMLLLVAVFLRLTRSSKGLQPQSK